MSSSELKYGVNEPNLLIDTNKLHSNNNTLHTHGNVVPVLLAQIDEGADFESSQSTWDASVTFLLMHVHLIAVIEA